jgi:adenylate cyclase
MQEYDPNSRGDMSDAQLRHNVLIPFNQILGYSEMLLDEADARGDEFVGSHVRQLVSDIKQLLGIINELRGIKAQRPGQDRLNRDLLFPLSQLPAHIERLVDLFRQHDRDDVARDVERILEAVHRLDQLVSSLVALEFAPPARS